MSEVASILAILVVLVAVGAVWYFMGVARKVQATESVQTAAELAAAGEAQAAAEAARNRDIEAEYEESKSEPKESVTVDDALSRWADARRAADRVRARLHKNRNR